MTIISVENLVACRVAQDGQMICLSAKDKHGERVELQIPFDQVGALSMTLPGLLSRAVKQQFNDLSLRYVYPLGDFAFEGSKASPDTAILSLKTQDGFEVSFAVRSELVSRLASTFNEVGGSEKTMN